MECPWVHHGHNKCPMSIAHGLPARRNSVGVHYTMGNGHEQFHGLLIKSQCFAFISATMGSSWGVSMGLLEMPIIGVPQNSHDGQCLWNAHHWMSDLWNHADGMPIPKCHRG